MVNNNERRNRRMTKVTSPDLVGLPASEHSIWTMGHAHLSVALAVCDAFAALSARSISGTER